MTSIDPIIINDSPFSAISLNEMAIPTTNYYKYVSDVHVPWTQPVLTSNNDKGIVSSAGGTDNPAYYLFANSPIHNANTETGMFYLHYTFPCPLTISNFSFGYVSSPQANAKFAFYTDTSKTNLMATVFTGSNRISLDVNNVVTSELYIEVSSGSNWFGIHSFQMTATQNAVQKSTSSDYDFYTENYSYKTYAQEETYTESVYGDDIWYPASKGPSASSAEMVCYCKNSIYVYGVSNSKNYLNYLSSSEDIATGMWTKTIRNSLTMYNPCCVDGNYVYCANSTKDGIVYGSTNATSMSAIETDFDFSNYTINFLKTPSVGGSLVCGFTSKIDPLAQKIMKGEFTLGGGITWDSSYKEPVAGLKGINYGNGKYIAVADFRDTQLYAMQAIDIGYHLNWTMRPLLGQFHTATIVGAEYLNGVYYFLHSDGMISCSDDGITWKIKGPISNSLTSNWDGLAIFGSNLVAINRSGDIMYVNPSTPETVEKSVYHYGGYYNPIINLPKQY